MHCVGLVKWLLARKLRLRDRRMERMEGSMSARVQP